MIASDITVAMVTDAYKSTREAQNRNMNISLKNPPQTLKFRTDNF